MSHYYIAQQPYENEVEAYFALESLQGSAVLLFYGSVSLSTDDSEPLLLIVPGIAIEHIDGVTLEHFSAR